MCERNEIPLQSHTIFNLWTMEDAIAMLSMPYSWMFWLLAAGLFFLLLGTIIAVSPVVIDAESRKEGNNDEIEVVIKALFGLIRYDLKIPVIRFTGRSIIFKKESSSSNAGIPSSAENENEIDAEKVQRAIDKLKAIMQLTYDLRGIVSDSLSKVRLLEWKWRTSVGTEDAVWTALATGFVWSAKSAITGIVSQVMTLAAPPQLEVTPQYNKAAFKTEWSCKANIRLGYALLALMRLVKRMKKNKRSFSVWRSILFKPETG